MSRSRRAILQTVEDRILIAVLAILFVASIIGAIVGVPAAWQTPIIVAALVAIMRLLAPVEEIHEDVKFLRGVASAMSIQSYATLQAFYADLTHAVEEAKETLDVTHIRDNPPDDFVGSRPSDYFHMVTTWLQADSSRSVRRVIAVRNAAMHAWAVQLAEAAAHMPNYQVRVVDWSVAAPAINMAIVDGRAVFLAITGDTLERTRGLGIEDQTVSGYFCDYYGNLWRAAEPLDDFLRERASNTGTSATLG